MKILILNWRDISHPLSGGAEIVTMEHAKAWVEIGHMVSWFTSWYPDAKKEEIVSGVRMIRRAGSLTVYPSAMWYLLFHKKEFDVIVDEVHGFPFFSVFFTRKPVVVFIHEIAGVIWDFMYPFPINVIGKFIETWYFKLYKNCLFWTDAPSTIDELVEKGIPREQCTAIPCPITLDKGLMIKDKRNPSSFILHPSSKEKYPTYIFVSRVVKMKGIEEVIKAFAFIRKEQPSARLWIVGGGEPEYIKTLRTMVEEYHVKDGVIFYGKVNEKEKVDLMRKAHILLHASVKEGWGLVVLEAALVGTPAIVYNVSGLKDVVKNRKTGVVISNNSPQEMAKEAVRLLSHEKRYHRYQQNGYHWVHSLNWKNAVKHSLRVLKEAIERR